MRNFSILLFLVFIFSSSFTQNLVPNPGFDTISPCPTAQRELFKASPWFTPSFNYPSTDLFNSCNSGNLVGVPLNYLGSQIARSGNGYAGIVTYRGDNTREYIEIGLKESLYHGKKYNVEFFVSLAENSKFAIDKIGLFFSNDIISYTTFLPPLSYCSPQIVSSSGFLTNITNWTKISGVYTAAGGERFITIGNFNDNLNTNVQIVNPMSMISGSNYYIDDVSVTPVESPYAPPTDTTNFNVQISFFSVYPNPVQDHFIVEFFNMNSDNAKVELFDVLGKKVLNESLPSGQTKVELNVSQIASGMYFYKVFKNNMELGDGKIKIEKL